MTFSNRQTEADDFDDYAARFDPLQQDRKARRLRKPKARHIPKKAAVQQMTEMAAPDKLEDGFQTTYQPSKYEGGWLLDSLRPFFDQSLVTDVLALVKGGKEASVYRCAAHPVTGVEYLAAKVYRPRMFRQLSNDQMYREGREVLTDTGTIAKKTDHRLMRALGKKTGFGVQAAHTSWLMYEFKTLEQLYKAGAAVPKPIMAGENAILMEYLGDDRLPAPALSEISLTPEEARPLFREVLRNIELLLSQGLIHGDLSAYNILYWEGGVTLIDFPQVTNSLSNNSAYFILERDVTRVCEYFLRQGVSCVPGRIVDDLWVQYVKRRRPEPMPPEEIEDEDD